METRRELAIAVVVLSALLAQPNVAVADPQARQETAAQARTRPAPTSPAASAPAPSVVTTPASPPPVSVPSFQSTLKFEPTPRRDDHLAVPLSLDRWGRPFVFATPGLFEGRLGGGVVANGQLPYALPSSAAPGGVQLDVQPWRAEVYVDGSYVGVVRDFTGYYHHLEVGAGPHVIAIVSSDYEPLVLDVFVSPGRVTTYHGSLSPASSR